MWFFLITLTCTPLYSFAINGGRSKKCRLEGIAGILGGVGPRVVDYSGFGSYEEFGITKSVFASASLGAIQVIKVMSIPNTIAMLIMTVPTPRLAATKTAAKAETKYVLILFILISFLIVRR